MYKECDQCGRELRCVMNGCIAYLERADLDYSVRSDLYGCFQCNKYFVFGFENKPVTVLEDDFGKRNNVIVASPFTIEQYPIGKYCYIKGGQILLKQSAIDYIRNKYGHKKEMDVYERKK